MFLFQASKGKSCEGLGGKESRRKEAGGLLAGSQTRTREDAFSFSDAARVLKKLPSPRTDGGDWKTSPREHGLARAPPSSARSFPGHAAKPASTCRLASATRRGAEAGRVAAAPCGSAAGGTHPSLGDRSLGTTRARRPRAAKGRRRPRAPARAPVSRRDARPSRLRPSHAEAAAASFSSSTTALVPELCRAQSCHRNARSWR